MSNARFPDIGASSFTDGVLIAAAAIAPWFGCSGGDDDGEPGNSGGTGVSEGSSGGNAGGPSQTREAGNAGADGFGGTGGSTTDGGTAGDAGAPGRTGAGGEGDHGNPIRVIYAVLCDANRDCCAESGFGSGALANCEDELMAASGVKYEAAYEAGTLVSDASAVAACAAAVRASASGCELMTSASRTFTELAECEAAFVGKVPVGGSCLVTEECEGSAYVECRDSVCREFPPGEEGDPCIMTERPGVRAYPNSAVIKDGARCRTKDGLYCANVSATLNRCAPIKADGAACTDAYSCGEESYCDGTCKPLKAIGQSCKSSLECLGLGCDPDSSKCTDVMPQAGCEAGSD